MANIKQIQLSASTESRYDIEAMHFVTGSLDTPAQWKTYIDNLVGQGLQIVIDEPNTAGTAPKTEASASTMGKLYMVSLAGQKSGSYTEFITVDKGSSASPRYVWEKIGTTDADLTDYAKKTEAAKVKTYTSVGPSTNATSSAGAETAVGTATISYDKSANKTGSAGGETITTSSAGAGTNANTGTAGAATVDFTKATFGGTAATITSTGSYQPAGAISTISHASHTHTVTLATATKTVVTGIDANTGNNGKHSHTVDSHEHDENATVLQDVTFTANGDDTFTKGSLPSLTVTSTAKIAQMSATVAVNVVTGISGGTASGTTTVNTGYTHADPVFNTQDVITGYPSFSGGSASGTFNTDAIKSIGGTKNYGFSASASNVMYSPVVTDGVLSWSVANASTQDAHTGTAASTGNVSWTAASLGTASTVTVLKNVKTAGSITSKGTTTVVTGVTAATISSTEKLSPITIGSASGWSAGSLPSFTQGAKASLTKATVSVAGASSAATLTSSEAAAHSHSMGKSTVSLTYANGTVSSVSSAGGYEVTPTFTGTTATLTVSANYTPAGSITGSQAIAAHSHSYTKPEAHTHSVTTTSHTHDITLTSTEVTGTASVAVSNHTHSLSSHTHNVVLEAIA